VRPLASTKISRPGSQRGRVGRPGAGSFSTPGGSPSLAGRVFFYAPAPGVRGHDTRGRRSPSDVGLTQPRSPPGAAGPSAPGGPERATAAGRAGAGEPPGARSYTRAEAPSPHASSRPTTRPTRLTGRDRLAKSPPAFAADRRRTAYHVRLLLSADLTRTLTSNLL
jgi:hypothetical protein